MSVKSTTADDLVSYTEKSAQKSSIASGPSSVVREVVTEGGPPLASSAAKTKTKMWQNAIAPDILEPPLAQPKVHAYAQNKAIMAVCVGLLTAVILAIVNPPMVQEKTANDITVPSRSVKKIVAWSLLSALIYFVIVWYMGFRKK
jgi:hypothetical protein